MDNTQKALAGVGVLVTAIATIMFLPVLMVLAGMFAGMMIGWVFPATTVAFLGNIGMSSLAFWQFGGMAAFVGGFFRTTVSKG